MCLKIYIVIASSIDVYVFTWGQASCVHHKLVFLLPIQVIYNYILMFFGIFFVIMTYLVNLDVGLVVGLAYFP